MKRVMASALLSVLAWSGCGSSEIPNTNGNCSGTVTVNMTNYGDLPTTAATATTTMGCPAPGCALAYFQASLVNSSGDVLVSTPQGGNAPLVAPNVTMMLGAAYTLGHYVVTAIAADGYTPGKTVTTTGAISSVAYVGRTTAELMDACPSPVINTMAPPTALDICLDSCTAKLRCGTLSYADFLTCQAGPTNVVGMGTGCNANKSGLSDQQANWVDSMASALAAKHPAKYPGGADDAKDDAATSVQQLVNAYEACNFGACSKTDSCAATALAALTNPMPS